MKRNLALLGICVLFLVPPIFSQENSVAVRAYYYTKSGFQETYDKMFTYSFDQKGLLDKLIVASRGPNSVVETKTYQVVRSGKKTEVFDGNGVLQITITATDGNNYELKRLWNEVTIKVNRSGNAFRAGSQMLPSERLIGLYVNDKEINLQYRRNGKPIDEFPLIDVRFNLEGKTPSLILLGDHGVVEPLTTNGTTYRQTDADGVPTKRFEVQTTGSKKMFGVVDFLIDYYLGTESQFPLVSASVLHASKGLIW